MIKKILIGVGVLSIGSIAILGWTPVKSYFKTSADIVRTSIEDNIPFAVEVKRLEGMIDDLNNVVRQHTRTCMERQVDYEMLQEELKEREKNVLIQKNDLATAQQLLKSELQTFVIADKSYNRQEVSKDTLKRLDTYEADAKMLAIRKQTTNTLGQALSDAYDQLEAMKNKRKEYAEMLQILRANHMQLEARKQLAATVKGLSLPSIDNEFGEVAELFNRLNKRIKVENQMIETLPQKRNFTIDYKQTSNDNTPAVLDRLESALGNKSTFNENKPEIITQTVSQIVEK